MALMSLRGTTRVVPNPFLTPRPGGPPQGTGVEELDRPPEPRATELPRSIPVVRLTNDQTSGMPQTPSYYQLPTWATLAVAGDWPLTAWPYSVGGVPYGANPALGGGGDGPAPTPRMGGGGGGVGPITWLEGYEVEGAPDWWKGYIPSQWTPESEYIALLNAMIPFMSPEDQRTAASTLARMNPDSFSGYNPEVVPFAVPTEISTELRRSFQSSQRAEAMLGALSNMAAAAGKTEKDLGPGYAYLRQIADTMRDYGAVGGEEQTRAQQVQLLGALDPLMAESKGDYLSAYGGVARMISNPFFSAGRLLPVTRLPDGTFRFGEPNPKFF